jgi:hypothetical protein
MSWWKILSVIPISPRGRPSNYIIIKGCTIFVAINAVECFSRKKELKNEIFY